MQVFVIVRNFLWFFLLLVGRHFLSLLTNNASFPKSTIAQIPTTEWSEGQASMDLEGILYFPNERLQISGGSEFDPVTTLIIADQVEFTGNTTTANLDGSVVRDNPAFVTVTLVE